MAELLENKRQRIYELFEVSPPEITDDEVWQQLMSFRNEWNLYRRTCSKSGASILSAYAPDSRFPVYKNDIWWGDSWDPLEYGRDFDFSRSFFEQYAQLLGEVPREGTSVFNSENCDYNSHIRESKNCYMSSLVYRCEDCLYGYWMVCNKDVVDCYLVNFSTLAYECIDSDYLYDCVMLQESSNCSNCYFSYQLRGCQNCIGCWDLVNKSYCFENKPVGKAEFERIKNSLLNGSYSDFQKGCSLFKQAYKRAMQRCLHNHNCENVIGAHIINSRNCFNSFEGVEGEDIFSTISFSNSKDIHYCYSAGWPSCELVYFSAVTRGSVNIAFCYYTFFGHNLRYCDSTSYCKDCFGCTGLKHKQYCILNKQYTADEYFTLKKRIENQMKNSGEWGRFLPTRYSTFGYNESAAQDFFPLTREVAISKGFCWREEEGAKQSPESSSQVIPDRRVDFATEPTKVVLSCSETAKQFRLIKQELDFYKTMNLPIPRFCPRVRHRHRFEKRPELKLYQRRCAKTGIPIYSNFSESRCAAVYDENVYLTEVVG